MKLFLLIDPKYSYARRRYKTKYFNTLKQFDVSDILNKILNNFLKNWFFVENISTRH